MVIAKNSFPPITVDEIRGVRSVGAFLDLLNDPKEGSDPAAEKIYRDELIPLQAFLIAEKIYKSTKVCIPCDGGPYDAVLCQFRAENGADQPLQITNAAWEKDDHLRHEYMKKHGGVGLFSTVSRDKEADDLIEIEQDCGLIDPEEINKVLICRVVDRIKKKLQKFIDLKGKPNEYSPATWLIVQMDDPWMTVEYRDRVCKAAAEASAGALFERIYVVSSCHPVFSRLVWSRP